MEENEKEKEAYPAYRFSGKGTFIWDNMQVADAMRTTDGH